MEGQSGIAAYKDINNYISANLFHIYLSLRIQYLHFPCIL